MNRKTKAGSDAHSVEWLGRTAQMLRMLAHPQRLKIVEVLEGRDRVPVHRIAEWLGLPHAAASQHLNQMRRLGLLQAVRHGKEVWYRIADRRCLQILKCLRGQT